MKNYSLMMHYDQNILKRAVTDLSLIVQYFYNFDVFFLPLKQLGFNSLYVGVAVKVNEQIKPKKQKTKTMKSNNLMMHSDRHILKQTFTDLPLIVQYFHNGQENNQNIYIKIKTSTV